MARGSTQSKKTILSVHTAAGMEIIPASERRTDEIVVAMVGPVGSGVSFTASLLSQILDSDFGYQGRIIKISELIDASAKKIDKNRVAATDPKRTSTLQDYGNTLRRAFGNRYLADLCVREINANRGAPENLPQPRRYFTILDSVKNPDEVVALREVYGEALWVIGVFAPETIRKKRLHAKGCNDPYIAEILDRDQADGLSHGQNVRATMELSDFFVRNDGDNDIRVKAALVRFLEIMFGVDLHTPSRDEIAMHAATSMGAGSACLSRQVGAVIMSRSGEIIGHGMNDVPKFGGGLYTSDDRENDNRCFKWKAKECHNDRCKRELLDKVEQKLPHSDLLKKGSGILVREAVRSAGVKDLIEFSRSVHAEMEAIISVARSGQMGLVGSTLYSTTYPCHNCARHIVASGITRVVFIEPYAKSQALDLHDDSISVDEKDAGKKVLFLQFEGVAPRNVLRLFMNKSERKVDGKLVIKARRSASPLSKAPLDGFVTREQLVVGSLASTESQATFGGQNG